MSYIERVLLPREKILYVGKVHFVTYMPGFMFCLAALAFAKYVPNISPDNYYVALAIYKMQTWFPFLRENFVEIVATTLFLIGVGWIFYAYTIAKTTELAVTDRRVIAKHGVASTETTEIDRRKIAGVIIRQTPLGQALGYGRVTLRGYTGDISGFPPLSRPYDFQKQVNSRVRY